MKLEDDIRILSDLVAYATVSDQSNLDIVEYIETYLAGCGAVTWRVAAADGRKASLLARIGPEAPGGLMLSAHTDVVPVADQPWDTDPFSLTQIGGRLYGRGAADMKGFIASIMVCASKIAQAQLCKPVYFSFSYDEELGCLGVHDLIADLQARTIRPDLCIVGEPTLMEMGLAHKGNRTYRLTFTGEAAHSSYAPNVVNAVSYAAEFVSDTAKAAAEFAENGPFDIGFDITHTTLHVGRINGGTQVNIVPDRCVIDMEIRYLPQENAEVLAQRYVFEPAKRLTMEMKGRSKSCGVHVEHVYSYPGFSMSADDKAVVMASHCGSKKHAKKLSFGTEAGCFTNALNIPVIVCGPGSIEQAHKPNEFIEIDQLAQSRKFILSCLKAFCM